MRTDIASINIDQDFELILRPRVSIVIRTEHLGATFNPYLKLGIVNKQLGGLYVRNRKGFLSR